MKYEQRNITFNVECDDVLVSYECICVYECGICVCIYVHCVCVYVCVEGARVADIYWYINAVSMTLV